MNTPNAVELEVMAFPLQIVVVIVGVQIVDIQEDIVEDM